MDPRRDLIGEIALTIKDKRAFFLAIDIAGYNTTPYQIEKIQPFIVCKF
jgi:hypothetical protein